MSTTTTSPLAAPRPRAQAPELEVPLVGGGRWRLADRSPERFTMIVFYRGRHCPICATQLSELAGRLDDFTSRGTEVIAISGDDEQRARSSADDWKLGSLTVGYDLPEASMREWGLFVSEAVKDDEADRFSEPAIYLVDRDGAVYYAAINSAPFARPQLEDLAQALDFVGEKDYPARGEA